MQMQAIRKKVIRLISQNDYLLFKIKYWRLRWLMVIGKLISDEAYIKRQYASRTGRKLNLDAPALYNEKVQYAKLYFRDERLKKLVDKYAVREYVKDTIGEKYLTKLYGVYDGVEDIPFDGLPEQFVAKLTNGSGYNILCRQKDEKIIRKIKSRFSKWLKVDFYMLGREWAYKDVKNRILFEEYLHSDSPYGLNDYKVFCFDGEPKMIQVDYSRFSGHKRNLYTPDWEFIDEKVEYENDPNADIPKPANLEEMLACARKLSAPFPHVRVDFYSEGDRLVFGEMTFYHGAGYLHFENEEYERELGSYWKMDG